ncbi:MAG: hypothetical protein PHV13_05855 [Candidatus ainarchaeum sp.]|nr:hypothetical protein [Candidatus ainarchaeum sp.]
MIVYILTIIIYINSNLHIFLKKTYKYDPWLVYTEIGTGGGSVNTVRRIRGVMGELGKGAGARSRLLNVEVISVGQVFRELDIRRLHYYIERPLFFRHAPM